MIDTRKLHAVRQELSREHGKLVTSVSRIEGLTPEVPILPSCEAELVRLGLIQEALRSLELVLQNYSQRSDVESAGNPEPKRDLASLLYPAPEEVNVILVGEAILLKAEDLMSGCEACTPAAELTFDYLLDALTGCDPTTTEYVLSRPAKCPGCSAEVMEKTLVYYG